MKKVLFLIISLFVTTAALAAWPNKEITIIVPYPPGGAADAMPRAMVPELQDQLKTTVQIKNMPGSAAGVAAAYILGEKNDNHTFLFADLDFVVGQAMNGKHAYKKFIPITVMAETPFAFYGTNSKNILSRFKAQMQNKSVVNVGYTGAVQSWLLQINSPLVMNLIPYKGGAPLAVDVMGGHTEYGIAGMGNVVSFVNDGKFQPIFVSSEHRVNIWPNVPTARELGFKGPTATNWFTFWVRNDTDQETIDAFVTALRKVVLVNPHMQGLAKTGGFKILNMNQVDSQKFMNSEIKKYETITK